MHGLARQQPHLVCSIHALLVRSDAAPNIEHGQRTVELLLGLLECDLMFRLDYP